MARKWINMSLTLYLHLTFACPFSVLPILCACACVCLYLQWHQHWHYSICLYSSVTPADDTVLKTERRPCQNNGALEKFKISHDNVGIYLQNWWFCERVCCQCERHPLVPLVETRKCRKEETHAHVITNRKRKSRLCCTWSLDSSVCGLPKKQSGMDHFSVQNDVEFQQFYSVSNFLFSIGDKTKNEWILATMGSLTTVQK